MQKGDARPSPAYGPSAAKNAYRPGVLTDASAEQILAADFQGRPGFLLDKAGSFAACGTTASSTYTPDGKSGEALVAAARRDDIFLKYCKYGRSQVMPEDKSGFWASTTQLAYGGIPAAGGAPPKVQDCLWGDSKFANRKVPVSVNAIAAGEQRAAQLAAEAAASPFRTVEQDTLAAAAQDPAARAAAKPPLARPRDAEGQDTQVGRKAVGDCTQLWDKDYVKIGLRKP